MSKEDVRQELFANDPNSPRNQFLKDRANLLMSLEAAQKKCGKLDLTNEDHFFEVAQGILERGSELHPIDNNRLNKIILSRNSSGHR